MSTQPAYSPPQRVVIADVDIPFWRLVVIFIKWMIASIPAIIIVTLVMSLIMAVFGAVFGLGWMMRG